MRAQEFLSSSRGGLLNFLKPVPLNLCLLFEVGRCWLGSLGLDYGPVARSATQIKSPSLGHKHSINIVH